MSVKKTISSVRGFISLSIRIIALTGCALLDKEKDLAAQNQLMEKAKQQFVDRTNAANEELLLNPPEKSPRRQLIQFTYGPQTLNNHEFLEYLVATNAVLPSALVSQIKQYEDNYAADLTKTDTSSGVGSSLKTLDKKIGLYWKLSKFKQISFSSTPLEQALTQLTNKTGIRIKTDTTKKIKLAGKFSGSIATILDNIAYDNYLNIEVSNNFGTLTFTDREIDQTKLFDLTFANEIGDINDDYTVIEKYLAQNNQMIEAPIAGLKSNAVKNFISGFMKENRVNQDVVKNYQESSAMRKMLISRSLNVDENQDKTSTIAIYDEELTNGKEKVIEKFSVYNDTPVSMKTKLEKYPVFSCGVDLSTTEGIATSELADKITNEVSEGTPQTTTATTTATATAATAKIAPVEAVVDSGCVKFSDDNSGIVASGSIVDVKLVEKLLVSQDTPVRQAMIEAYILEVSTDWRKTLESKLTNTKNVDDEYPGLFNFATGILDLAQSAEYGGISVSTGRRNQLQYLVNFIESNKIGKKVSNPVILVKDGEEGVVEQTRTYRAYDTTSITNSTTTTSDSELQEFESPITLTVTPAINEHNDDIDLTFSYEAESYDTQEVESASTTNTITSKLKVKPGQIIMMAGLFQETKYVTDEGIPGLSDLLTTPLKYFLGIGGKTDTLVGSEILVFLNPMVITNENMDKTMTRARYNKAE